MHGRIHAGWVALLMMGCAGMAGCAAGTDPGGLLQQALGEGGTGVDGGGVVLETNVIRGRMRFTNQNPEILALLDADVRRWAYVTATSTSPTGFSASIPLVQAPSLRSFDFELTVEAAAGGPEGVSYSVTPRWQSGNTTGGRYTVYEFQPLAAQVRPRDLQPSPVEVAADECVGMIRFQFGTDATCNMPVSASNVLFNSRELINSSHIYVRGGTSGTALIQYTTGSSWYVDYIGHSRTVSWSVACDQVITVCTAVPSASELGALTGPWEIVGEQTRFQRFLAFGGGPDGNQRLGSLTNPPFEAPISDPSRWWVLPNMVPGDFYNFYGSGGLRQGREFTTFAAQSSQRATVAAGHTTPVTQVINNELRYPFVMHPAYLYGSIRLIDPYLLSQPGAYSTLSSLFFEIDSNGDGIPDTIPFNDEVRFSTSLSASRDDRLGFSHTSFRGGFSPLAAELSSDYQQVLPSAYDIPGIWGQRLLRLGFWAEGTSSRSLFVTRPSEYDPARFRYGYLDLTQRQGASAVLGSGQSHRVDHEYCFNEVQVAYFSRGARFYNPTARLSGGFRGTDWRGANADYSLTGLFYGVPAAIGIPQSEAVTYAATEGSVSLTVPQGSYTLTPSATLVNANNTTNVASFQPITFTVGCGQRLRVVPPLAVNITPQPSCTAGAQTTVSGRVQSSPAVVDRIWYRLNDGPEVELCTNCGIDPSFSFPVTLQACENTVTVYAYSAGLPEPATGFQQLLWDDPVDGPSCTDSTCVNRRPVARCRNLIRPADGACQGTGSIDDGSSDPDGDALTCVQSDEGPFGLGTHRVTLTCTDARGASSSCEGTITVQDQTPPELTCPQDQTLECLGGGAQASFAPTARDTCSTVTTTCTPASGTSLAPGTTTVTCTAVDGGSNRSSCIFAVTVADTLPPTITCPAPLVAECTGQGQAQVTPAPAMAADSCSLTGVQGPPAGSYPLGTTAVTYTASDAAGHQASCSTSIQVVDTQPPRVEATTPVVLWPMNLRYHTVHLSDCGIVAEDVCGGVIADATRQARITCVTSDEPAAAGRGPDIAIIDSSTVQLRADRLQEGDGRVYRIHFRLPDVAGQTAEGVCTVTVPRVPCCGTPAGDSGEQVRVCSGG